MLPHPFSQNLWHCPLLKPWTFRKLDLSSFSWRTQKLVLFQDRGYPLVTGPPRWFFSFPRSTWKRRRIQLSRTESKIFVTCMALWNHHETYKIIINLIKLSETSTAVLERLDFKLNNKARRLPSVALNFCKFFFKECFNFCIKHNTVFVVLTVLHVSAFL